MDGDYLSVLDEMETLTKKMRSLSKTIVDKSQKYSGVIEDIGAFKEPPVDIENIGENLIIRVDLPGVRKKDIKVNIIENILTVKAERKHAKKDYYLQERDYAEIFRTIALPVPVKGDKATAKYEDGVLIVVVPKSKDKKEVEISIE